ncbi:transmembrane 220 family protein [Aureibaculum sp. 2210JD6-5]|uniref:transmembrane 220 family protein n=1 Tax=Aureibaculum sp. 2210JD6-5 TaxID=3103957 RepID=UPI002AADC588|nr:transmembrane 220 family protein [Aureibaculum sp. 2210JD6-5]MDY7395797.1 transmembrane 220 family protein [Aureibaculum sp. 2210JD6-5]
MRIFFKSLGIIFTILFLWSAYLQLNDPDPLLWIVVYLIAALASLLFALSKLNFLLASILALTYFIGAILNWPESFEGITFNDMSHKNIEEGREALGLLFCGLIFTIYGLRIYCTKNKYLN